jgi:hypothetical protein
MVLISLIAASLTYYFLRARAQKRITQEAEMKGRLAMASYLRNHNAGVASKDESKNSKNSKTDQLTELWVPSLIGEIIIKLIASVILVRYASNLYTPNNLITYVLAAIPISIAGFLWIGPFLDYTVGKMTKALYGLGEKVESQAKYDQAESKWKMGHPHDAIKLIEEQLEYFPEDYTGQLLKAEIQKESLRDFASAEATLLEVASQKRHGPGKIAGVLNQLADWHLTAGDQESAKRILLGLSKSNPNSQIEFNCSQRIARLDFLLDSNDTRDASELVSLCLKQLDQHPLDIVTREQLARIYFERYGKPELAWEEMAKLLSNPFQKPKDICRWLNLMANWHIEKGNPDGATECLNQIISRYPNLPYCERANERLMRMKT